MPRGHRAEEFTPPAPDYAAGATPAPAVQVEPGNPVLREDFHWDMQSPW